MTIASTGVMFVEIILERVPPATDSNHDMVSQNLRTMVTNMLILKAFLSVLNLASILIFEIISFKFYIKCRRQIVYKTVGKIKNQ